MKASDDLFTLIRSMSSSEKRYFKIFAARHSKKGNNNYIRLFDAIDRQESYDESRLARKLAGTTILRNLASTKYQLYQLVLKCLSDYHSGKSLDSELREMIDKAQVLYDRGLYAQCGKLIEKAKLLATANERYPEVLEILRLERGMFLTVQTTDVEAELSALLAFEQKTLDLIRNQMEYYHLFCAAFALEKVKRHARSDYERAALDAIANHRLLSDPGQAISFSAKGHFHRIHAIIGVIKGDAAMAFSAQQRLLQLWKEKTAEFRAAAPRYKSDLINYLNYCTAAEEYGDFEDVLAQLKQFPARSFTDEISTFQDVYHIELLYYLRRGFFDKGTGLADLIALGLQKFQGRLTSSRIMTFCHNLAVLYFLKDEHTNALQWLNRILDHSNVDQRRDIQDFARILLMVIHYELGNHDALESLLRSTYRYLHARDKLYEFERIVIRHMRKIQNTPAGTKLQEQFDVFGAELAELKAQPGARAILGFSELQLWVESRQSRLSLQKLYLASLHQGDIHNLA